ncbi:hypothetical protein [Phenylobacterium sp.]|jgi:hypothetical protein|uniref:hypothetical protein n=1 Tax=Phenylobacterium sp. TaxID=1871053 RepID=UPI002E348282|nr:hypothetical protein [Phenylobacterium sp.]HEX2562225.1 hypothetical protein [Phenylobacterium sp.]
MQRGWRLAAATLLLCPHVAEAGRLSDDAAVTVIASASADLGLFLKGSAPTTFHIDPNGGVTPRGGDFVRLRGGDVSPQEVVIRCEPRRADACRDFREVIVTVTGVGYTKWPGRAGNFSLDPGSLQGAELVSASVGPQTSIFVLACAGQDCGPSRTIRFNLAFDVRIDPGAASDAEGAFRYNVSALWQ